MSVAEIEFDEGQLMPISLETLSASDVLPFDLYLPGDGAAGWCSIGSESIPSPRPICNA